MCSLRLLCHSCTPAIDESYLNTSSVFVPISRVSALKRLKITSFSGTFMVDGCTYANSFEASVNGAEIPVIDGPADEIGSLCFTSNIIRLIALLKKITTP